MRPFVYLTASLVVLAAETFCPEPACAQTPPDERAVVIALADTALAAISRGDFVALTDLMVDEAQAFRIRPGARYSMRTRAEERATKPTVAITERGFRPVAHVSGPLAMVWLPYDLYIDGRWSHCGVDAFIMVHSEGKWRITSMAWSVEQPPACERHPSGPPRP